jgi:hypothetical protein
MEMSCYNSTFFVNNYVIARDEAIQGSWNNIINGLLHTSQWQYSKREFNDIADFSVWDKVSHHKFWNWLITSLTWEIAEIEFAWVWSKKMNIKIAPVKKI